MSRRTSVHFLASFALSYRRRETPSAVSLSRSRVRCIRRLLTFIPRCRNGCMSSGTRRRPARTPPSCSTVSTVTHETEHSPTSRHPRHYWNVGGRFRLLPTAAASIPTPLDRTQARTTSRAPSRPTPGHWTAGAPAAGIAAIRLAGGDYGDFGGSVATTDEAVIRARQVVVDDVARPDAAHRLPRRGRAARSRRFPAPPIGDQTTCLALACLSSVTVRRRRVRRAGPAPGGGDKDLLPTVGTRR